MNTHNFKIEIVISSALVDKLIKRMEDIGIYEYTMFDVTRGRGHKEGDSRDLGLSAINAYLFSVVTDEQKNKAVELLSPFFKTVGGLFMISEVTCIDA
jgi:nitrogen regulatory protein PII